MKSQLKLACGGIVVASMLIGGCHTIEGAGRDVQALGAGVESTAESVRHDMRPNDRYYYDGRTRPLTPRRDW